MLFPVIESERIKHGINKDDFARLLGVSRRTVQNWQNGSTEVPLAKLRLLTEVWKCSADYLLGIREKDSA